jgi:hypothetical protein
MNKVKVFKRSFNDALMKNIENKNHNSNLFFIEELIVF